MRHDSQWGLDQVPHGKALRWASAAAGLLLAVGATVRLASAQPEDAGAPRVDAGVVAGLKANVWMVQASAVDAGTASIDQQLEPGLRAQFSQGPFKQFNVYQQLDHSVLSLQAVPVVYKMANGSTLKLSHKEPAGPGRHKLLAEISATTGSAAKPTSTTFTAGHANYMIQGPFGPKNMFLVISLKP